MARPKKPASLNKSNRYSKEEKEMLAEQEDKLKGNTDQLYDIPDYLDDLAKEYYKFIIDELEVSNLLSNLDIPLIEQTADSLSKMRQCDEIINKDGIAIEEYDRNNNLQLKEHPTVTTKMKYMREFRQLSTQLGMSPSSRASLAALNLEQQQDADDPLLQILENRHKGIG